MFQYKNSISINNIDNELNNVSEKIRTLELPKGFLEGILYTISELFANIKEHSKARGARVQIKINNKNCCIEISDDGIGIRKSYILKNIYPKDDFSAIEFALSGLSTKDVNERGFGLYTIRKFSETLQGKMTMESGRGSALIEKNKIEFRTVSKTIKGVRVSIEINIKDIDFYQIIK